MDEKHYRKVLIILVLTKKKHCMLNLYLKAFYNAPWLNMYLCSNITGSVIMPTASRNEQFRITSQSNKMAIYLCNGRLEWQNLFKNVTLQFKEGHICMESPNALELLEKNYDKGIKNRNERQ